MSELHSRFICYLQAKQVTHVFEGPIFTCKSCNSHGCQDHSNDRGICLHCEEIQDNTHVIRRKLENPIPDLICKLSSDQESHTFEGSIHMCQKCSSKGCSDHMHDSEMCQCCHDFIEEDAEFRDRCCSLSYESHVYVGPRVLCHECLNEGCPEHMHASKMCCYCYEHSIPVQCQIRERTCEGKDHSYTGRAYECEDCNKLKCKQCLLPESLDPPGAWEARLQDNVFLCWECYRNDQRRQELLAY